MTMLASPLVSGTLLSVASLEAIFFIDVVTAAIGISIVFFFVKTSAPVPSSGKQRISYFHDLREGFAYIQKRRFLKHLFSISAAFLIMAAPVAFLTPLQVTRTFGAAVWRLSAVEIAFSAGMMIGGLLIGIGGGFRNKIYSMGLSCALLGVGTVFLGMTGPFWLYIAGMGAVGLVMPFYNVPSMALLQSKVDEAFMGRVCGVYGMVSSVMMPVGMLIFGPLSDVIAVDTLLIFSGSVMVVLSFTFIASTALREAGKPQA
jgi:DHA3 family macrolide efflux protein-like MFS transporter